MTPELFPLNGKRIWVAGHRGMVGSAIVARLEADGIEVLKAGREDADLRRQADVEAWVAKHKPDAIIIAAAKVGGILANATLPGEFLYDNLMIQANIIEAARICGVAKVVVLGSSCIYPKLAPQPIDEASLLTGPLEPTNEAYAVAKIAGIRLGQAYRAQYGLDVISAMPTNLYGPNDNFDLASSHVLPALVRKAHDAKMSGAASLTIWGTGAPRREFLHAQDCADAVIHLLKVYSDVDHVNVGFGEDIAILDLAKLVAAAVGFDGAIETDPSKPDGTPKKLLNSDRLRSLGWSPKIDLKTGVRDVYTWFLENKAGAL